MTKQKIRTPAKTRRVTAKDVAEAAGVSRSAVSRAFTKGAYLDEVKRRKIHDVAAELGYQPNALAAGLQTGQANLIAIFVGNMRSPYDSEFVSYLVRTLNGISKWPILIDGSAQSANEAVEELLRYPLDALILRGGSMPSEIVDRCARMGVPMISSGRPIEAPHVDNVCCKHAEGTTAMTRLLLNKGRKRFGFIDGPESFFSSAERRLGVTRTLEQSGLALTARIRSDFTVDGGHKAAADLLENHALDALICANDAMAIGAVAAAHEIGRDVPKDLSIVGFDNITMANWPTVNLTTVCNPIELAVDQIIRLLEARLAERDKVPETRFVAPYLVERGTH